MVSSLSVASVLQAYFEAFNRGDTDAMEALVSEQVEHHVNQGAIRPGKVKFREFNAHMKRCYKEQITDLVIFENGDNRGAAEFTVRGQYLETDDGLPPAKGQRYELPAGSFFALEDGKITRITTYYNLKDWTAQVTG